MRLRRAALGGYLATVAGLMLWPGIVLPETAIRRPDLIAHAGVFGLLTLLVIGARPAGEPTLGARNIAAGGVIALVLATGLEWMQGLPGINRTRGVDDAIANGVGVFGVCASLLFIGAIDDQKREGRSS